jgi:hypothetical protein
MTNNHKSSYRLIYLKNKVLSCTVMPGFDENPEHQRTRYVQTNGQLIYAFILAQSETDARKQSDDLVIYVKANNSPALA